MARGGLAEEGARGNEEDLKRGREVGPRGGGFFVSVGMPPELS